MPSADEPITISKTVGESDVYLFAGITGDLSPVHVDHEYMKRNSPFGERIAHGVLLLGYTSAASTVLAARLTAEHGWKSMVSLGYDGIRFVAPVRIGDTITVRYRLEARDEARQRTVSAFDVVNQRGETVLAGRHLMKWFA
ncbi:MAG: MaoC family dehydratase N-terminal domain-containing protein [Burkholderiales bacterium]|nr:MaoC family dehydratase N-terminal domain-containing protein [Burkholderiales bacterium]GIK85544.1 MAG: dehydratase [Betaproteobacteria bacterium]